MNVSGVGGVNGSMPIPQQTNSTGQPARTQAARLQIPQDSLEISEAAKMMTDLQAMDNTSPDRSALIARIQSEIANGTYDTDEKMEMAFMKFMQQEG
ncbi:MAG: flagellar biosynthesis anti-sigma factor FlgM [Planctomycetaceae bacterium]|nr:flagellar biosynthesis anti-sigma factor FlgM [Planctomycetaceae bacterium]